MQTHTHGTPKILYLTSSIDHSASLEANSSSADQEIPRLIEPAHFSNLTLLPCIGPGLLRVRFSSVSCILCNSVKEHNAVATILQTQNVWFLALYLKG